MGKHITFVGRGLALALVAIVPYYFLLLEQTQRYDPFYHKATYHSPYLVLGASRAQKGISPAILQEELQLPGKALNFAFTAVESPYGAPYLDLVKRKLGQPDQPGLFILSVHPATLMDYELARGRREEDFRFYDLYMLNRDPNPEYVLRNVNNTRSLLPLLLYGPDRRRRFDTIHDDGWVERNPPDSLRPTSLDQLPANRLAPVPSPKREKWLKKTVEYLSQHGKVVLVRLPTRRAIREKEDEALPHFEELMTTIASETGAVYWNYADLTESLSYADNFHHLDGTGARAFTRRLAQDLKAQKIWQ